MTRTDIDRRPPATIEDLMYVTGLGRDSVRELVKSGQLPGRKLGGKYVIPAGEFDKFVAGEWTPEPIRAVTSLRPDDLIKQRKAS